MTYAEKLKDPRWQRKRLQILERDKWFCRRCGDDEAQLHVHHIVYRKGVAPWDYADEELVTLCEHCHGETEETQREIILSIYRAGGTFSLQAVHDALAELDGCSSYTFNGWCLLAKEWDFLSEKCHEWHAALRRKNELRRQKTGAA